MAEHGLDSADAVLLAGASDGGMAVFQHVGGFFRSFLIQMHDEKRGNFCNFD